MKVYLVIAEDCEYDVFDRHVVAAYSDESKANAAADRFNAAARSALAELRACGENEYIKRHRRTYRARLHAELMAMGDPSPEVLTFPGYEVEAIDLDVNCP